MNDPIRIIQKCLDGVYNHLLFYVEEEFNRRFGCLSPSVTGIDEAIARVKSSKTYDWGKSLEFEGDFSDLDSNCNKDLLGKCIKKACHLAKLDLSSVNYILTLMMCVMTHSYFHEPNGIYRTLNGFSMGDCSAARGSEIILRVYELEIYNDSWQNINYLSMSPDIYDSVMTYLSISMGMPAPY